MKQLSISDPFPASISVASLTILVAEDFCGYAEISWRGLRHEHPRQAHSITCRATPLLQGLFCNARGVAGDGLTADEALALGSQLGARVIALVIHEFYKQRIQHAAQLEAVYQWRSYEPEGNL